MWHKCLKEVTWKIYKDVSGTIRTNFENNWNNQINSLLIYISCLSTSMISQKGFTSFFHSKDWWYMVSFVGRQFKTGNNISGLF